MKVWLYYRLSRDEDDELNSLTNQRKIIYEYAVTNGHEVVGESFDDNVSGMHFNREGIDKIYEAVEAGKIEAIIVKDLSRFGRNSIETGYFIERVFPLYHTRFISVSDDFDTVNFKGDTGGIDVAFKYLISECYSRDMSMKTKMRRCAGASTRALSVLTATAKAQTGVWSRTKMLREMSV